MTYQVRSALAPGLFDRLGVGQRVALMLGGGVFAVALLCCGGATVIGAVAGDPQKPTPASGGRSTGERLAAQASDGPATTGAASDSASPTPTASPKVETRAVTETAPIAFGERTVKDSSLAKGTRVVRTRGVPGQKTLTYEVTLTDGVQTGKRLLRQAVTRQPKTQVVAVGTKPASSCDPNYGGCVPIASDVDCAGGSGNGPAYVEGPVKVIGSDIYDLDRDGDGYGCD
jgi:hypothetical protein